MLLHRSNRARRQIHATALFILLAASASCTTQKSSGVVDAVTTPISDLNIIRAKIPPVLLEANDEPFAIPDDHSCDGLAESIADLDAVLETNHKDTNANGNPGLAENGSTAAGGAAVDALRRTAEGFVPFRGWVRKLSGAERHSKLVANAIASGLIRRAFLKGYSVAMKCPSAVNNS